MSEEPVGGEHQGSSVEHAPQVSGASEVSAARPDFANRAIAVIIDALLASSWVWFRSSVGSPRRRTGWSGTGWMSSSWITGRLARRS